MVKLSESSELKELCLQKEVDRMLLHRAGIRELIVELLYRQLEDKNKKAQD